MKNLLILLMVMISIIAKPQAIYRYDYIETFDVDWSGSWWTPIATTNYYTNAFVSSTSSAVLYGVGNGSSGLEQDWYSFPNLVVNPVNDYYLTFRLASYRFTSTAGTRGVDAGDYVTVQLSTNGGSTYVNELRITGNANAYWNYNSASYTKTANGTQTIIGPAAAGDRTSTGDGYSNIRLNIPSNTSNIAIDIYCRVNSAGEEWWLDNFELHEIVNSPLPVELLYFEGTKYPTYNLLRWSTASENNSDYFSIEMSTDGFSWKKIGEAKAAGNSNTKMDYSYVHSFNDPNVHYYKLLQYDYDGKFKEYGPIGMNNTLKPSKLLKIINLMGQEIGENYKGIVIEVYEDGTIIRTLR